MSKNAPLCTRWQNPSIFRILYNWEIAIEGRCLRATVRACVRACVRAARVSLPAPAWAKRSADASAPSSRSIRARRAIFMTICGQARARCSVKPDSWGRNVVPWTMHAHTRAAQHPPLRSPPPAARLRSAIITLCDSLTLSRACSARVPHPRLELLSIGTASVLNRS